MNFNNKIKQSFHLRIVWHVNTLVPFDMTPTYHFCIYWQVHTGHYITLLQSNKISASFGKCICNLYPDTLASKCMYLVQVYFSMMKDQSIFLSTHTFVCIVYSRLLVYHHHKKYKPKKTWSSSFPAENMTNIKNDPFICILLK